MCALKACDSLSNSPVPLPPAPLRQSRCCWTRRCRALPPQAHRCREQPPSDDCGVRCLPRQRRQGLLISGRRRLDRRSSHSLGLPVPRLTRRWRRPVTDRLKGAAPSAKVAPAGAPEAPCRPAGRPAPQAAQDRHRSLAALTAASPRAAVRKAPAAAARPRLAASAGCRAWSALQPPAGGQRLRQRARGTVGFQIFGILTEARSHVT